MGFHADWAAELGQLLFQLENSVAAIYNEELLESHAVAVFAVAKPVEAIMHLAVPRRLNFPIHFFNVS